MKDLAPRTIVLLNDGNSGTAKTVDWSVANRHTVTLTGNVTFTFTSPGGDAILYLRLVQDGTGSRTVTWPAAVKWPAATPPTLTVTAAAVDIVVLIYDSTTAFYYAQCAKNFS